MNNNNNINIKNIDYGIKHVTRFGKSNDSDDKNENSEGIELRALEIDTGASIVKIETISSSRIVLLCIKIL